MEIDQNGLNAEADRLLMLPDPTVPISSAQARMIGMELEPLLLETFGSAEIGRAWLEAPNPVLAGETPAAYLQRGDVTGVVKLLLLAQSGTPT